MVSSRSATAGAGLDSSGVRSAIVWLSFDSLLLFLIVPFVPFLFRGSKTDQHAVRTCPICGFRTRDPSFQYCPRDGHRLD